MKKLCAILMAVVMLIVFSLPVMAQTNWSSGPYVGLNAGYGSVSNLVKISYFNVKGVEEGSAKGIEGGLEVGYNLRKGNIIFGIAGDLSLANINGSKTHSYYYRDRLSRITSKAALGCLDMFRGRLGCVFNHFFVYGTGGIALSLELDSITSADEDYNGNGIRCAAGQVFGGGVEYAMTSIWSVKAEYLRVSMKDIRKDINADGEEVAPLNIIQVGISYHF